MVLPPMSRRHLGVCSVYGRSLSPFPAASIIAFMLFIRQMSSVVCWQNRVVAEPRLAEWLCYMLRFAKSGADESEEVLDLGGLEKKRKDEIRSCTHCNSSPDAH